MTDKKEMIDKIRNCESLHDFFKMKEEIIGVIEGKKTKGGSK